MEGMWSLIFFTLLVQASSGIVIWEALCGFEKAGTGNAYDGERPCTLKIAMALALLGTLFSLLHLSAPAHSVFTVNNIFFSWLSREIFCVGLFVTVLALYLYKPQRIFLYAAAAAGLILSYAMSKIYTVALVPYWQNICVFGYFVSSSLVLGAAFTGAFILACPCAAPTVHERLTRIMKSWIPVALGFSMALRLAFAAEHAAHKVQDMSNFAIIASPTLLSFALFLLLLLQRHNVCCAHDKHKAHSLAGLHIVYAITLFLCVLGAEVLGRIAFYQGYTWFGM